MAFRVASLALLLLASACAKPKEPPATTTPATSETTSESAPVANDVQLNAALQELTQAVRRYGVEQRQAPKSLDELVAKGYLGAVPQAPPGKKFAIDKKLQVYLSDQ